MWSSFGTFTVGQSEKPKHRKRLNKLKLQESSSSYTSSHTRSRLGNIIFSYLFGKRLGSKVIIQNTNPGALIIISGFHTESSLGELEALNTD